MEVNNIFANDIGEPFKIPVIYITQLLGIAMGMDPSLLGLIKNHDLAGVSPFIPVESFLNIVKDQLI
jgi:heterodisulfide reductase subunit B